MSNSGIVYTTHHLSAGRARWTVLRNGEQLGGAVRKQADAEAFAASFTETLERTGAEDPTAESLARRAGLI